MMCGSNRHLMLKRSSSVRSSSVLIASELEDLIEGCFDTCRLGVVEHVGHDYPVLCQNSALLKQTINQ